MSIFLSLVLLAIGLVVPFVLVALIVLLVVRAVRRQSLPGRLQGGYRVHQRSRGSYPTMPFFYGDPGSGGIDSDWARDSGTWSNDSGGSGCGGDSGSGWSSDSGGSSSSSDSGSSMSC